jgi:transcriptional regulator with PAS, ATPase and Fis domain
LIESELFGHAKGAFTGATEDRIGKLAAVGEGTIFLDEVDSLSLESQARLLRVADERVFEPVGSNAIVKCHARIIAATSRSLRDAVQMRQFRNDLYYRLNVIAFELPPLRQRRNLISRLTERWLQDYADAANRPIPTLNEEVRELLQDYHWPGNIRELRNVIERVTVLCTGGVIRPEDLPPDLATSVSAEETSQHVIDGSLHEVREKAEVSAILNALTRNKGNRTRAAEDLGVSRVTLHKKIREYGLRTA